VSANLEVRARRRPARCGPSSPVLLAGRLHVPIAPLCFRRGFAPARIPPDQQGHRSEEAEKRGEAPTLGAPRVRSLLRRLRPRIPPAAQVPPWPPEVPPIPVDRRL
jgi:hypothetical protein